MHGYTVFDNNAYKRASVERIRRLAEAERSKRIVGLASVVVLQEMLARARDANMERRSVNRAAIRKLGLHCAVPRAGKTIVNFITHTDGQVFQLLRGFLHPSDSEMFEQLGELVGTVTEAQSDDSLAEISDRLAAIESTVTNVEAAYVAGLGRVWEYTAESNQMKRNLDYAAEIVRRTASYYGEDFAPTDVMPRIIEIAKSTSIGFALRDSVVAEVRAKRGGHGQHANTVWDEEVVSSTSMYTTVRGKTLLLVTEEERLLKAAAAAGASDRVCRLADYELRLGLPPWESAGHTP